MIWTRRAATNSPASKKAFAIGGVSSSKDSFVVTDSSVLRMNICGKKPAHRQAAKRCGTFNILFRFTKIKLV